MNHVFCKIAFYKLSVRKINEYYKKPLHYATCRKVAVSIPDEVI
jgi:hypothetical protein